MNLATRCATCGTLFRVVQDQLKVSDGWVRCGHCQAVFNALESLFDLDREALPDSAQASASTPDRPVAEPPRNDVAADDPDDFQLDVPSSAVPRDDEPAPVERRPPEKSRATAAEPSFESLSGGLVHAEEPAASATPSPVGVTAAPTPSPAPPPIVPRRRPHRAAWAAAMAVLALALIGQVAVHERDRIAARWPALRPTFEAGCAAFGCRLELLRSIDEIAVESTGLARTALPGAFRLSVGLRNRGTAAVATPSVELSLTDTKGELVARRVLAPADFDQAPASIRPGAETTLQALLGTPESLVSGYTVEVFYP